jgi:hypothetical protein
MKRKREIEMAKTALKMEEEELDIETDIAVADAKSKVYDHLVRTNYKYSRALVPSLFYHSVDLTRES